MSEKTVTDELGEPQMLSPIDTRIAELEAALDQAVADVAELMGALEFIKELEPELMFRGHGENYIKAVFPEQYWARLCRAHAALDGDG